MAEPVVSTISFGDRCPLTLGCVALVVTIAPAVIIVIVNATIVESLASINFGLGTTKNWRTSKIISDATLAILGHEPPTLTGEALIDEDVLRRVGVTDFEPYRCEPGGELIRIAGTTSIGADFGTGAGGSQKAGVVE